VNDFDDLTGYRRFIDEIVSRKKRPSAKRSRPSGRRFNLCPDNVPPITRRRSSPLRLRRLHTAEGVYTVPSRLIGHRLRVRLYDDRLDLFVGGTVLMTLTRGRATANGKRDHVIDYRHVIHALRRKPMALLDLVYREQLFPRDAFRRTFERLLEKLPEKSACRIMVDLLALAHERGCEAELAAILANDLAANNCRHGGVARTLRARPNGTAEVAVHLAPLSDTRNFSEMTWAGAA